MPEITASSGACDTARMALPKRATFRNHQMPNVTDMATAKETRRARGISKPGKRSDPLRTPGKPL